MNEPETKPIPWHKGNGGKLRDKEPDRISWLNPRLRVGMILVIASSIALALSVAANVDPHHLWQTVLQHALGLDMGAALIQSGAFAGYLMEAGEYGRLVASLFLHVGIFHLIFNMMAMLYFANWLESRLGGWRFLMLYLGSGVAGNLFVYGAFVALALTTGDPELGLEPAVGASGAIFGLFGAILANEWAERGALKNFLQASGPRHLVLWMVLLTLMSVVPFIRGLALLGGLGAGFVLGLYFFVSANPKPDPRLRMISHNALYALIAACVICLIASARPIKTIHEYNQIVILNLNQWGRSDLALAWAEKKMAAAGEDLLKAPASDEGFRWRRQYAQLLIQNCEYSRASGQIRMALERKPNDPQARYHSGVLNWRAGNLTRAEADFRVSTAILAADRKTTAAAQISISATTSSALSLSSIPSTSSIASTVSTSSSVPRIEALLNAATASSQTVVAQSMESTEEDSLLYAEMAQMNLALMLKELGQTSESASIRDASAVRFVAKARAALAIAAQLRGKDAGKSWLNYQLENHEAEIHAEEISAAQALNQAAWLFAILDARLDEALAYANEALGLLKDPAIMDTRGWIYFKKGLLQEALMDLLEAAALTRPPSAEIYYHIGALFAALKNRHGDARTYLDRALDLKQDFDGISEAKRLLKAIEPKSKGPITNENMACRYPTILTRENLLQTRLSRHFHLSPSARAIEPAA
ncbi:MAG: rhomboid family intramembrane serine protease [Candidatus Sumerlaeota bacterium]|nr:rhomboid family intramembrane serine protease [Candidatus Sumerlaeota bacterium]